MYRILNCLLPPALADTSNLLGLSSLYCKYGTVQNLEYIALVLVIPLPELVCAIHKGTINVLPAEVSSHGSLFNADGQQRAVRC